MSVQTEIFNQQHNVMLPDKCFHLSHGALWQLMQHMVQVAGKASMPISMHFGLGTAQTISSLLPLLNSGNIGAVVYHSEAISLNNGRLSSTVQLQALPSTHPFSTTIFALAASESWNILFWATAAKSGFDAAFTSSASMVQRFAKLLNVESVQNGQNVGEMHSLTADLLWRLNKMFDRPQLLANGLNELAQPFQFAHTLRMQSGDKRWQQAVWTIQDILKSKKSSIYRLDEQQNALIPLASDGFGEAISLFDDCLLTRAIVMNQLITGREEDVTVLAMPVAEGDIVWGGIELHFYNALAPTQLHQAALYAKIIEQALLDYGMPQESALSIVEQMNSSPLALAPVEEAPASDLDQEELAELMALLGLETAVSAEPTITKPATQVSNEPDWNSKNRAAVSGEEPFPNSLNAEIEAFLAQQTADTAEFVASLSPTPPESELSTELEGELRQFMEQNGFSLPELQEGGFDLESRLDLEMQIQELTTRQQHQPASVVGDELPADLEAELAAYLQPEEKPTFAEQPPAVDETDDLLNFPSDLEAELAAFMAAAAADSEKDSAVPEAELSPTLSESMMTEPDDIVLPDDIEVELAAYTGQVVEPLQPELEANEQLLPPDLEAELADLLSAGLDDKSISDEASEHEATLDIADHADLPTDEQLLPLDLEAEIAALLVAGSEIETVSDEVHENEAALDAVEDEPLVAQITEAETVEQAELPTDEQLLPPDLEAELAALLPAEPNAEAVSVELQAAEPDEAVGLEADIVGELEALMPPVEDRPAIEALADGIGLDVAVTLVDDAAESVVEPAQVEQEAALAEELDAIETAVSDLEARVAAQQLVREDSEALLEKVREERLALEAELLAERAAKEDTEKWYYSEQSAREELTQGLEIFRQEQVELEEKLETELAQQEELEQSLAAEQAAREKLQEELDALEAEKAEIAVQLTAVQEEAERAEAAKAEAAARLAEAQAQQAAAEAEAAQTIDAVTELTETKLVQELVAERAQSQNLARLVEDLRLFIIRMRARFLRLVPQSLLNSIQGQMFKQLVSEADTAIEILQDVQLATDRQGRKLNSLNWLALVEEVLLGVQPQLHRYGLRVVETSPRFSLTIAGDRDRLTHMLYNFFRGIMMIAQPNSEWWLTMEEVGETAVFKVKSALAPQHAGLTSNLLTHFQNGVPQRNYLANAHTLAVQNGGLLTAVAEEDGLFAFSLTFPTVSLKEDVS